MPLYTEPQVDRLHEDRNVAEERLLGPTHQPTFVMAAWAKLPDGRSLQSEPVGAPSKKAAQTAAADRLPAQLAAAGLTRW